MSLESSFLTNSVPGALIRGTAMHRALHPPGPDAAVVWSREQF